MCRSRCRRQRGLASPPTSNQFAVMGEIYRAHLRHTTPASGLLSVGEEESKGNELTKKNVSRLRDSHWNFVGNVGRTRPLQRQPPTSSFAMASLATGIEDIRRARRGCAACFFAKALDSTITSQVGALLSRQASPPSRRNSTTPIRRCPFARAQGVCIRRTGSSMRCHQERHPRGGTIRRHQINAKIEQELAYQKHIE